jgi:hypothetical protein
VLAAQALGFDPDFAVSVNRWRCRDFCWQDENIAGSKTVR